MTFFSLLFSLGISCSYTKVQPKYTLRHSEHRAAGDIKEVVVTESKYKPLYSWILPTSCGVLLILDALGPDMLYQAERRIGTIAGCAVLGYGIDQARLEKTDFIYECSKLSPSHKSFSEVAKPLSASETNVSRYLKKLDCNLIGTNPVYLDISSKDHPKYRSLSSQEGPPKKPNKNYKQKNMGIGLQYSLSGILIDFNTSPIDISFYFRKDFKRHFLRFNIGLNHDSETYNPIDIFNSNVPGFHLSYGRSLFSKEDYANRKKGVSYHWTADIYSSPERRFTEIYDDYYGDYYYDYREERFVALGGGLGINYRNAEVSRTGLDFTGHIGLALSTTSTVMVPISIFIGSSF